MARNGVTYQTCPLSRISPASHGFAAAASRLPGAAEFAPALPVPELAGVPSAVRSPGAEALGFEEAPPAVEAAAGLEAHSDARRWQAEGFQPEPVLFAEAVAVPSAGRRRRVEALAPQAASPVAADPVPVPEEHSAVPQPRAAAVVAGAATPGAEVVAVWEAHSAVRAEERDPASPEVRR